MKLIISDNEDDTADVHVSRAELIDIIDKLRSLGCKIEKED